MSVDWRAVTWPREALGAALLELARALGLNVPGDAAETPPAHSHPGDSELADWLRASAARAGLGLQHADCGYSDTLRTLRGLGAALVGIELAGERRYLAVLASRARRSIALTPARRRVAVAHTELAAELTRGLQQAAALPVDTWLRELAIAPRRARTARQRLYAQLLCERRVGPFFLLSADPGVSFALQLRQRGLSRVALVLIALASAQVILSLAGWAVLGRSALEGHADMGWISAWILLQLGAAAFQLAVLWFGGALVSETALLLKRRLLAGALRVDAERIRRRGAGRLLAMVFESEALETAGLGGAFAALLSLLQLASAVFVLAAGLGGPLLVLLLLAWGALCGALALAQFRARAGWTRERFALARAFVESIVGSRTRVVQEPEQRWHLREDRALERYAADSRRMDDAQTRLLTLPARGWLVIGLAGLVPALVGTSPPPAALVIALGGILQAYGALAALCGSSVPLASAAVAWSEVRELFHAAAQRGAAGAAAALTAPRARASCPQAPSAALCAEERAPILDAHGVSFSYPAQPAPVLSGCALSLREGDRVLLEGPSGAGKSTLAALLAGLHAPDSGHISIAGFDRATLGDAGWRRRITSAPQFHENHILSASFAFNLLMGRTWPAPEADLREAERVCAALGLDALLSRMPSGLQQAIGETGWQLSHGERSRLFLARALLQDTDVLILDETFGALDPDSLRRCLALVLERARTLVVIAHP